jgi:hypothetical protein
VGEKCCEFESSQNKIEHFLFAFICVFAFLQHLASDLKDENNIISFVPFEGN